LGNSRGKASLIAFDDLANFFLSAEKLTGRLYAVDCTVGIVTLSICQTNILISKSVVGILPPLSE